MIKTKLIQHLKIDEEDASYATICKQFWLKYFFLFSLIFVVVLGALCPSIGHKNGILYPPITASWIAVCLIFLITGLGVKSGELKKASLFWQLILFVHFFIYIYHPLIGYMLMIILEETNAISITLVHGLMITLCLPTTITSAVILTLNANGNEAAAVVNCTSSNIIGIGMTPALILLFLRNLGSIDVGNVFFKLSLRVLLPFGFGQIVRNIGKKKTKAYIKKHKPKLKKMSELFLLFIIFCSISESFYVGIDAGILDVVFIFIIIFCIQCTSLVVVWFSSNCLKMKNVCNLKFTVQDRVAILFTACQKTAAFGIPIIATLYEDDDNLGIYTVPLLIYHPMQLVIHSLLITPLSNRVLQQETALFISEHHLQTNLESDKNKNEIPMTEITEGNSSKV